MFVPTKEIMRHVLLNEFHEALNPNTETKFKQNTLKDNTLNKRNSRWWFSWFASGYFTLKDNLL